MNEVKIGDNSPKLYIGDILIYGGGKSRDFNGIIDSYGIKVFRTYNTFNPQLPFEMTFSCTISENSVIGLENRRCAIFGTADYNNYWGYPSVEISRDVNGNGEIWLAYSTNGSSWFKTDVKTVTIPAGKHIFKLTHIPDEHSLVLEWNGVSVTSMSTIDGDIFRNGATNFCFGNNGDGSAIVFPRVELTHINVTECRLVSNGNVLFGYTEE